jgi:type II secretory pathway pseudopilin PulG
VGLQHARTSGFTVVEVFMVVTLLAIVAGLMVTPIHGILESFHVRPLEEVALSTVRKAHMQARLRNETVILSYLSTSNCFQLCTRDGIFLEEILIDRPAGTDTDEALVAFYRLLPEDPERNEPAYEQEEEPTGSIPFHPCGASTPFAITLKDRKNLVRLVLDPFSSEPVLREEEGNES